MRIDDLAELLGKTRKEVEEMLNSQEVIELRLSERNTKLKDEEKFKIFEY